jgi:hypothetical protein
MADNKKRVSRSQPSLPNVPPPQMGEIKKPAPQTEKKKPLRERGSDLFIVDNSDDQWKAARYLHDWCDNASAMDIATGYFEIGALLALDGQWQKLDQIRILMGDEVKGLKVSSVNHRHVWRNFNRRFCCHVDQSP